MPICVYCSAAPRRHVLAASDLLAYKLPRATTYTVVMHRLSWFVYAKAGITCVLGRATTKVVGEGRNPGMPVTDRCQRT